MTRYVEQPSGHYDVATNWPRFVYHLIALLEWAMRRIILPKINGVWRDERSSVMKN